MDKIYHQIYKCRKGSLPHVFRELIEESERLVNAYLLPREYRYLFKKDTDFCSMKEFYKRLKMKKESISTNDMDTKKTISDNGDKEIEDDEDCIGFGGDMEPDALQNRNKQIKFCFVLFCFVLFFLNLGPILETVNIKCCKKH